MPALPQDDAGYRCCDFASLLDSLSLAHYVGHRGPRTRAGCYDRMQNAPARPPARAATFPASHGAQNPDDEFFDDEQEKAAQTSKKQRRRAPNMRSGACITHRIYFRMCSDTKQPPHAQQHGTQRAFSISPLAIDSSACRWMNLEHNHKAR